MCSTMVARIYLFLYPLFFFLFSEVFYIHRASVWGVRIQDNYIVTGSMDGTIAVIDAETLVIKKHFVAHENEWGSKYLNNL